MEITRVYYSRVTEEERKRNKKLIGIADIVLDHNIAIHDICLLTGDKGYYILFPNNYRGKTIAFPVTNEARLKVLNALVYAEENMEIQNDR